MSKTTIEFRTISPWDQAAMDYCRRGYREKVIPSDAWELIGRFIGRAVLGYDLARSCRRKDIKENCEYAVDGHRSDAESSRINGDTDQ